jgi:hypothetical protein
MEFRRSGQRDERRRRVLIEDAKSERMADEATSETPVKRSKPKGGASYAEGARADRQPRVTDLIPTRLWTLLVLGLLGASAIAALQSAYVAVYLPMDRSLAEGARGLDLAGSHSLARWFSAGLFALSAVYAVLIFTLRRHRVDDYRGRYRIWIPTAMFLLLASMESIGEMRNLLGLWMDREIQVSLPLQPAIWWVIVALTLAGLLVARLLIEMRRSRLAVSCALLVVACYGGATTLWSGLFELPDTLDVMAHQGLILGGNFLAFFTLLIYARHVFLDAQGRITPRSARRSWLTRGAGEPGQNRAAAKPKTTRAKATAKKSPARAKTTSTGKSIRVDSSHDEENQDAPSSTGSGSTRASSGSGGGRATAAKSNRSSGATSGGSGQAGEGGRAASNSNRAASARQQQEEEGEGGETLPDVYIDPETGAERKLSKAERRKLRKESRRHQRI